MRTEELVKRCVNRDYAAWDLFVKRYENLIIRSVRYKLKKFNADVASDEYRDIVQETFLSIWDGNKLSRVRDISSLKNWLVMVTLNRTSNYCKRRWKEQQVTRSLNARLSSDEAYTLEDIVPCNKSNPIRDAEANEMMSVLRYEINKLRMKERKALELNVYDGKKQTEIARIMGIPVSTVATLIHRAKKQVREGIGEFSCS